MKLVIRLFNLLIMALAAAATIFLFAFPSMSFTSNIAVDVKTFAKFVPETKFTKDINIVNLLGTDTIHVGIKFKLYSDGIGKMMHGNKEIIDENIVSKNVDDMIAILHEPVDLITEYSIKSIVKSTIKEEITKQVEEARTKFGSESTAEEIMDEVGIDDEYFTNFTYALYDAANADDATVDSVSDALYVQIDEALAKAEDSGMVDNSGFTEEKKEDIKTNLVDILDDLKLVEDGGKLKKISQISYIYLADYLKEELKTKVDDPSSLDQKTGESSPDYADRLLHTFVITQMPDIFYQITGYVSLALFIGLFVFAGLWVILFLITLIKTFTRKPWTIFGFWFWLIGPLQLVLGIGITIFSKFVFPTLKISYGPLPIQSVLFSIRTYAIVTSIVFVVMIGVAIVYAILRGIAKRSII